MEEEQKGSNLPPPEQRCNCKGFKGWQCKNTKLPGHVFCRKHSISRMRSPEKKTNKKRRTTTLDSEEKEQNPVQNAFRKGQQVEVASQEEGFEDSWFIATVVHPSNETNNKKCFIEYRTLESEDGLNPLREYVDVCHLRPLQPNETPPLLKPGEVVDAYVNDGWWKGVVTKVTGISKYSVFFRRTNEEMEFQLLELRHHMEWIDEKWVEASRTEETGIMAQNDGSSPSPDPTKSRAHRTDMDTSQTLSEVRDIMLRDIQPISRSTCRSTDPNSMLHTDPKNDAEIKGSLIKVTEDDKDLHSSLTKEKQDAVEAEQSEHTGSPKPHAQSQKEQHFDLPTKQLEEPLLGTGLERVVNQRENVTKRKRGRPQAKKHKRGSSKSLHSAMTRQSKSQDSESANKETTNVQTELTSCNLDTTVESDGDNEGATSKDLVIVVHEPLLTPSVEDHPTLCWGLEKPNLQVPEATEDKRALQPSVDVTTLQNDASLFFIKKSNKWKELESEEVFKLIPQSPHFLPLEKQNEELREGLALGYMSAFASLWERTCKATLDNPSSVFETRLKALADLESLGFSVKPLRSRLEQMLKIKERCTQFDKFKMIDREVLEEKRQKDAIEESITELDTQLQVLLKEKENLDMQLQLRLKDKENKMFRVAELERVAEEIKESIEGVNRDFQNVVAAPWN